MRKRELRCACRQCKAAEPYARCPWRGKMLKCDRHGLVDLFKVGSHVTARRTPRPARLTRAMKEFAREMADQGLKPARIRTGLMRKFELRTEALPSLRTVQKFVHNYMSNKVGGNDYVDDVRRLVREAAFTGHEQECDAFTFTWRTDMEGRPFVGNGADANPFLVGVTSKALLRQADRDPSSFVLHIDATFKLNQVDYPVFVVGISDRRRGFHLLAIFVSSQRQETHFTEALMALRRIYTQVTGKQLAVRYAMGDADDAQHNAVQQVFGVDNDIKILMCFYHVAAKVFEKTSKLHPSLYAAVAKGVHDMHFAADEAEFLATQTRVLKDWSQLPGLAAFSTYFTRQWLKKRCWMWQIYHTPPSFAVTNNPVESFNATLKRDYTLRARMKMGALLRQLMTCCAHESTTPKPFTVEPLPSKTLIRRAKEMRRAGMLFEMVRERGSIAFLLNVTANDDSTGPEVVRVLSRCVARVYDPETKRSREALPVTSQLGEQTARMEIEGMPELGWAVDTQAWTCPCKYWTKFAACIHTLLAKHVRGVHALETRERLVHRGPNRRQTVDGHGLPGRPLSNTPALQIE